MIFIAILLEVAAVTAEAFSAELRVEMVFFFFGGLEDIEGVGRLLGGVEDAGRL